MADKFVMSSRQSAELDHAFERNGWVAEDVKWLSEGDTLTAILGVRRGTMKVVPAPLLELVGTAIIPATTTPFVAADHFVINEDAAVKISYLGNNFKAWLLGKKEQSFSGSTLRYGKLSRWSKDGPIIDELGGEAKAETTLTELFSLMQAQKNGKSGPLLVNSYANIFYVRDVDGLLRAVHAHWDGPGWYVSARPVLSPPGWFDEFRVFSRDSRERLGAQSS